MIPKGTGDITADWLNEVLQSSRFLENTNIKSVTHQPWGVGEGFVSDMARLTITYDRKAPGLPKTMIAKLPTPYESGRAVAMQYNIYEREIRFYNEVAPKSPIGTPGLIYSEIDSENQDYVLLMQDCSHYELVDQIKGLNKEQTELAAIKLADFHARWWDADDLISFQWMPKPGGPEMIALIDTFRFSWDISSQNEIFVGSLPKGGFEAGMKIREHYPWLVESITDKHQTISHFDYRADNMFFGRDNSDDPLIVIDWGAASVSRGVGDLAYMIGGSVQTSLRRAIEQDVLKLYYQHLLEKGVYNYSFDECWNDYLKGLLFFTFIGVLAVASLDMSDPRGQELIRVAIPRYFSSIVDNDATSVLP